jgi:hypothetical protein
MADLRSCYQTATVKDVCSDCENWANKQLDEIRNANAPELRRRIAVRVNEKSRPSMWRRIFKLNTEVRHARASDQRAPSVGPSHENP